MKNKEKISELRQSAKNATEQIYSIIQKIKERDEAAALGISRQISKDLTRNHANLFNELINQ